MIPKSLFSEYRNNTLTNLLWRHKEIIPFIYLLYKKVGPRKYYNNLRSFYLHLLVSEIRKKIIKKDITGIRILKSKTILELSHNRIFYWEPYGINRLIDLALNGEFEGTDVEVSIELIKKGDIIFDVGANYGYYTTLWSRLVGDSGKIHSFEPLNKIFDRLKENVNLNKRINNIILNNFALGEKNYKAKIYTYPDEDTAFSSMTKLKAGRPIEQICKVTTIDSYMEKKSLKKLDFIKCDIEGGELFVFKGAKDSIKKYLPILLFESNKNYTEKFQYKPKDLFNFLKQYQYSFYHTQLNYIAIPKHKVSKFEILNKRFHFKKINKND